MIYEGKAYSRESDQLLSGGTAEFLAAEACGRLGTRKHWDRTIPFKDQPLETTHAS